MVHEHDGNKVVCGLVPGKSASISGLLRDSAYPDCPAVVSDEEMGLLDSMAFCECGKPDPLSEGGTGIHADCKQPVSDQRDMVALYMV